MMFTTAQMQNKTKPARNSTSCPRPATIFPASSEPKPGVPSSFSNVALRAFVCLVLADAEDGFIRDHYRGHADGAGDDDADAAAQHARRADQPHHDRQAENVPPMPVDHRPARLHRRPEGHLLVD